MLEQPDSPTASHTKQQVFDHYLYRLQNEIHTIIASEAEYEERVKSLETDLAVFKRACFTAENDKRLLHDEITKLKERLDGAETLLKNSEKRIICLIDGDGTIFSHDLLAKGQDGGRSAAKQLSESVSFHLPSQAHPCQLWVYVFYNKRGLLDTFARAGAEYKDVREGFEDFVQGFNQSSERFMMVDVGSGKEAADAKVKAFLDDHARSQETYKVVFGGCHDNGYIPTLHSIMTAGLHEKLVLLAGYREMASEMRKLQLPSLVIPDLFMAEKIITPPRTGAAGTKQGEVGGINTSSIYGPPPGLPPPVSSGSAVTATSDTAASIDGSVSSPPPPYHDPAQTNGSHTSTDDDVDSVHLSTTAPSAPGENDRAAPTHVPSTPVSYRTILQTKPSSPHQNSLRQAAEVNNYGEVNGSMREMTKSNVRQKRINPNIPLSQHDPPPCTLFYLAINGCKHGPECRFGHDYILGDDDYEMMRMNAKKVPCPAANRGEPCVFGDNCCYGHYCPFASRCHFVKQGKCKFSGPGMHGDN